MPEQYRFLLELACEIETLFLQTFREVNGLPQKKQLFEAYMEAGLLALKNGNAVPPETLSSLHLCCD